MALNDSKWYDTFKQKSFWGKLAIFAGGLLTGEMGLTQFLTSLIGLF